MKSKLRPQYHASLDTRSPLKPDSLHKAILRLATILNDATGITFPPINHHLLTFYHVKKLGLPCKLFPIKHLNTRHTYKITNCSRNLPSNPPPRNPPLHQPHLSPQHHLSPPHLPIPRNPTHMPHNNRHKTSTPLRNRDSAKNTNFTK